MGKIEQNKEKKRQAILGAALEIFISEGYMNTSMDKIAEKAQVTKQTVYRYFPSKEQLFKETLQKIGENSEFGFLTNLEIDNSEAALLGFAKGFVAAHLHPDHLATFRLLITEHNQVPGMTEVFHGVGADNTELALVDFFKERLLIPEPADLIHMWTGMLLSLRTEVLMGRPLPSSQQIEAYAEQATHFLIAALSNTAAYHHS